MPGSPMLLIVNCIADPVEHERFNRNIVPMLQETSGRAAGVLSLADLDGFVPDSACTHLMLSGSELSAARRHPTDRALISLIRHAVDLGLAVLGICYGHQMIARALVDDSACRRARVPEFGFKTLSLADDPLFAGIQTLTPVHSHYDEVTGLPEERFAVIASTDHCAVQALRLRQRPVWGVQFHPELGERSGRAMLAKNLETEAAAREHFVDELQDPTHVEAGRLVFENFLRGHGR